MALLVGVFLLRLVYLVWLSPLELVGDEAYYWEQSRHLDWCYNEKGPALPWMIAACCRTFGDTEWAVRLPVALSSMLAAWAVGRLAMSVAAGDRVRNANDERIGFYAVAIFCLLPAFQANAQICTQDGPLIALWVALTAIGLRLQRRWRGGLNVWGEWVLLWFVLGVGFLFKQSILLFLPSVAVYWMIDRRSLRLRPMIVLQQLAGVAIFLVVISPMIWWNAQHGWPLFAHTVGHLGAGGDQAGLTNHGNPLSWLGITIGGIVGAFGPACVALMLWTSRRATGDAASDRSRDRLWLLCAAWPSAIFFVALSFIKPVVPSWPLPGLVPLVVLIAEMAASELPKYAAIISDWRDRKRLDAATAGTKPETPFHQLWFVLVAYGIGGWLLLSFPNALAYFPIVGPRVEKSLLKRVSGQRALARDVDAARAMIKTPDGAPPLIVTPYYMDASLLAFYLPDHPRVFTAGKYLGKRSTTFDQWSDTNLENSALLGRSLLLVSGRHQTNWQQALKCDLPQRVDETPFLLAANYGGPRQPKAETSAAEED